MTLLYSYGPAGGFSIGRTFRRVRSALRTIHRSIAVARIRRLRNELRLHAATRANWARSHQPDADAHGDRFPRQPLHLGENGIFDMRQVSSVSTALLRALARLLTWFGNEPIRAYRPEAYYMRGPGPAWRAKHGEG